MASHEAFDCPICPFRSKDSYDLLYHVETVHPEDGDSPFVVAQESNEEKEPTLLPSELVPSSSLQEPLEGRSDSGADYVECMCGEFCLLADFDDHLDMHTAEGTTFDDLQSQQVELRPSHTSLPGRRMDPSAVEASYDSPFTPVDLDTSESSRVSVTSSPRRRRKHTKPVKEIKRLGKADLGPFADELQMPDWLRRLLESGAKVTITTEIGPDGGLLRVETIANEIKGAIPVLSQLCEQDPTVAHVRLCHSAATHVVKMPREGGFCGYRNIQMLIAYIKEVKAPGHEHFPGRIPSILKLQDMIESAWDMGYGDIGRVETGGIRGTRKFIGTPEAQSLFDSLGILCIASTFRRTPSREAYPHLLRAVKEYFDGENPTKDSKVVRTNLPPIYFQHPGHSLTIVGIERNISGEYNLLVFDPMFQPSPAVRRLIETKFSTSSSNKLLKAYRKGSSYLKRYDSFELLKLERDIIT